MKIAIIGAGFTGLSAAYTLVALGHTVEVFEKDEQVGGLAIGFSEKPWEWTLEKHYHHWFTNDDAVLSLAKKIHYPVVIKRPKTCVYVNGAIYQLDSPFKVLTFPLLSLSERLRMAAVLGFLRYNPFWKPLEAYNATKILRKTMGEKAYTLLWDPQMSSKFGSFKDDISLAWFWARVRKRTADLAYPEKGFLGFANHLSSVIEKKGGKIHLDTEIMKLTTNNQNRTILTFKKHGKVMQKQYDKTIVTVPSFFFTKIAPDLPKAYSNSLLQLKGLGAINLFLRLKRSFFSDNTYWLSVCEKNAPILAIVEHTNFMDKKHYNNEHLLYLGNYLPKDHEYFSLTKEQLLKRYHPFLQKIHPNYEKDIIDSHLFAVPFAQPIIPPSYSKIKPPFNTPLPNVYLANMQQVYPWDRGTNYAVAMGEEVVQYMLDE